GEFGGLARTLEVRTNKRCETGCGHLLRRCEFCAQGGQLLDRWSRAEPTRNCFLQLLQNSTCRGSRSEDSAIALPGEIGDPALNHCRQVRCELRTLCCRDRDDASLATAVQRPGGGEFGHRRLNVAGDHVRQ